MSKKIMNYLIIINLLLVTTYLVVSIKDGLKIKTDPENTEVVETKKPDGEYKKLGGYYFDLKNKDLNSEIFQDEEGCIFMTTEFENGTVDIEFLGGCKFEDLYK